MADIVHEAQDTHLCALFIKDHGDSGHYEYALDAANSAAKHLQTILAKLPTTSPLSRDAGRLAKFVRAAQRNLSQQCPANTSRRTPRPSHQPQRKAGRYSIKETPQHVSQWDSIPPLLTVVILTARKLLLVSKLGN